MLTNVKLHNYRFLQLQVVGLCNKPLWKGQSEQHLTAWKLAKYVVFLVSTFLYLDQKKLFSLNKEIILSAKPLLEVILTSNVCSIKVIAELVLHQFIVYFIFHIWNNISVSQFIQKFTLTKCSDWSVCKWNLRRCQHSIW